MRGGACCLAERGTKTHGSKYRPRSGSVFFSGLLGLLLGREWHGRILAERFFLGLFVVGCVWSGSFVWGLDVLGRRTIFALTVCAGKGRLNFRDGSFSGSLQSRIGAS